MKILAIIPEKSGSSFYRIRPQMRWMKEHGHQVKVKTYADKDTEKLMLSADLVIFENIFSPYLIKKCHKANIKVVIETDDLVHSVPKTHYDYKDVKGLRKYKWLFKVLYSVFLADGFIVSNKQLAKVYGWINKKVLVFPNYCDIEHWIRPYKKNQGNKIRILWAGSKSHTHDLLFIKPIINKILNKYQNVQFVYIGMGGTKSKDLYAKFIYGDDVFKDINEHRESLLGVDAKIYPHILATIHADLAIAPLTKDYFNKFKTPCKYLEYSINQIPAVYSKWFYKNVKGLLADTPDEWVKQISRLVEDEKLRKELGRSAFADVLNNYDIKKYLNNWQDFIEQI